MTNLLEWALKNREELIECRPKRGWNAYTFRLFTEVRIPEMSENEIKMHDWEKISEKIEKNLTFGGKLV